MTNISWHDQWELHTSTSKISIEYVAVSFCLSCFCLKISRKKNEKENNRSKWQAFNVNLVSTALQVNDVGISLYFQSNTCPCPGTCNNWLLLSSLSRVCVPLSCARCLTVCVCLCLWLNGHLGTIFIEYTAHQCKALALDKMMRLFQFASSAAHVRFEPNAEKY